MTDVIDVVVRAIGWTLLHSVWQGALVALLTAVLLRVCRGAAASTRYLIACIGLAALIAGWSSTAIHFGGRFERAAAGRHDGVVLPPTELDLGRGGPLDLAPAIRPLDQPAPPHDDGTSWQELFDTWSAALVTVWLIGVVLLSVRFACGCVAVARLRHTGCTPPPPSVDAAVATLAGRLRLRRAVRVARSTMVHVPTVIGWLRPVLLLPVSALTGLTPQQLEAVLAHELAHVRRYDYAVNLLQSATEILLFYHPACWWLSRRIRIEREHCCDDVAVALCGDRLTYAAALADLESMRGRDSALALAATDGSLSSRIRRVIVAVPEGSGTSGWGTALLPFVVVVLLVSGAKAAGVSMIAGPVEQSSVPTAARTIAEDEGVIQGRVVDDSSGLPIPDARVQIMGEGSTAPVKTDARGRYELNGIKPGSYLLSVRATGYVEGRYGQRSAALSDPGARVEVGGGRLTTGIDVRLQRAGNISGRILDEHGDGLAGVEIVLVAEQPGALSRPVGVAFAQTVADGSYRLRDVLPGEYYLRAYTTRDVPARGGGGQLRTYAATFYPNGTTVEEAQPLRVYPGQELFDVTFALAMTRKFRVSGTVTDPGGETLAGVRVQLRSMTGSDAFDPDLSAGVDAKGRFEIANVAPGDYTLAVRDARRTSRWVSAMRVLTVDADLTDVELRAVPGAYIEGRVVRDLGVTTTFDTKEIAVGFEKRMPGWGFTGGGRDVGIDGRFSFESAGGPVLFKVSRVPRGWMVKSIRLDGAEIGDEPIDLGTGRRRIEVVLTDKVSAVLGVVTDRYGRALPNFSVVIFPPDSARWHDSSRFIHAARSDSAGQFRLEAVPPGDYLAVAVAALPGNRWKSPDVLARLRPDAAPLRVDEGEQKAISIRASPTPEGLEAGR